MENRTCPHCGQTYLADPARLKHGRQTTCSRACSYALRAQKLTTSESLACASCGVTFTRSPAAIKGKHGAQFCSRECHYAGRSTGATKRVVVKPYTYTPESKAAQIAAASRPKGRRVYHLFTCLHCGKEFDDPQGSRKRKSGMTFCSLDCCNAYRVGENNPSWRGGYPGYYGPRWRPARRAARTRDNYTCRRCGLAMKPPGRLPDVHHIIPVGTFTSPDDAHSLDNLVTLCHPCHMHVEWHGMDFAV